MRRRLPYVTSLGVLTFSQPSKRPCVGGLPSYILEYDGNKLRDQPLITIMKADGPTPELMMVTFAGRRHAVVNENATIAVCSAGLRRLRVYA